MKPILSIVIPVYNNDRYLEYCLDSLLKFQIADKELYEIIIINDGSTDNSYSIMETYSAKYKNIVTINQENAGVSVARNKGISVAKGKYIWFVDGDDFVKADCIRAILDKLCADVDVYHFCGYAFKQNDYYENMINENIVGTSGPDIWTYIFSSEFINTRNIRFEKGIHYCETQLFVNDVNLNTPKCMRDNETWYFYRKNEFSVTATNRQRKVTCYFDLFELLIERLEKGTYPMMNSIEQIESILRMRFQCAMDDMSIVTQEQINRGKELSRRLNEFILENNVPRKYKCAFKQYKKLCSHCDSSRWSEILSRWRKKYQRKKDVKFIFIHPKSAIKNLIKR